MTKLPEYQELSEADRKAWSDYWKGLGPRPIPVNHESVKRVAKQIREMKS